MTVKRLCGRKRMRNVKVLTLMALLLLSIMTKTIQANADESVTFNLAVTEVLSVSLDPITTKASGNTGDFLRNQVDLTIASNSGSGFVAYMTTKTDTTALSNTTRSASIPTLAANSSWTRSSSTTNFWGYSLNDDNNTGTYYPMVGVSATPIEIASRNTASNSSEEQTVYFGAKINSTKDAGTYYNTVVFTVVSGMSTVPTGNNNNNNEPQSNNTIAQQDLGGGSSLTPGRMSQSATDEDNSGEGENTKGLTYTPPQGVSSSSDIHDGDPVTTGLIATASVAAGAGVLFLILAKRDDDDEDEEGAETA